MTESFSCDIPTVPTFQGERLTGPPATDQVEGRAHRQQDRSSRRVLMQETRRLLLGSHTCSDRTAAARAWHWRRASLGHPSPCGRQRSEAKAPALRKEKQAFPSPEPGSGQGSAANPRSAALIWGLIGP